jgi:hypothetical protein
MTIRSWGEHTELVLNELQMAESARKNCEAEDENSNKLNNKG